MKVLQEVLVIWDVVVKWVLLAHLVCLVRMERRVARYGRYRIIPGVQYLYYKINAQHNLRTNAMHIVMNMELYNVYSETHNL
jgi:hypothetical protein